MNDIKSTKSSAIDDLTALIESKTSVRLDDIKVLQEDVINKTYRIEVKYKLFTKLIEREINGSFKPTKMDVEYKSIESTSKQALANSDEQITVASKNLTKHLEANTSYNDIKTGTYLCATVNHYCLPFCNSCQGEGQNICSTCLGKRTETCPICSGCQRLNCTNSQCINGSIFCYSCSGSGTVTEPHHVPTPNGYGKTIYVTRRCYHCSGGHINCPTCNGRNYLVCNRCDSNGNIDCRTCTGNGLIQCSPCVGTGKRGRASSINVNIDVKHSFIVSNNDGIDLDGYGFKICEKEKMESIVRLSSKFVKSDLKAAIGDMVETYSGTFYVNKLDVLRLNKKYRIVSYGNERHWYDIGDILNDTINVCHVDMNNVLIQMEKEDVFAISLSKLTHPLKSFLSMKINIEIINSSSIEDLEKIIPNISNSLYNVVQRLFVEAVNFNIMRTAKSVALMFLFISFILTMFLYSRYGFNWTLCFSLGLAPFATMISEFIIFNRLNTLSNGNISNQQIKLFIRIHNIFVKAERLIWFSVLVGIGIAITIKNNSLLTKLIY